MKMLRKALKFAAEKHKSQTRKVSDLPYIVHPFEVSLIISKYKDSKRIEELMVASILHDTLEDTSTNFVELSTEFTPLVAALVLELTNDNNEIKSIGKNEYLKKKMVGLSNYALVIKLADRLSNISDSPSKKYVEDTIELIQHLQEKRHLSGSQKLIIEEIKVVINENLEIE
jgi:(p)ppGpp synthase/HD superfamily hydrolase